MSAVESPRSIVKTQSQFLDWWDRNNGKLAKWTMISLVVAYVAFLFETPIAALTFGVFEQGIGKIISSLNKPEVFLTFWNTFWISLVVVSIHERSLARWSPGSLCAIVFRDAT